MHRFFRTTSNWKSFDEALKTNQDTWLKNQYPESWTATIVNETIEKLLVGKQKASKTEKKEIALAKKVERKSPPF